MRIQYSKLIKYPLIQKILDGNYVAISVSYSEKKKKDVKNVIN